MHYGSYLNTLDYSIERLPSYLEHEHDEENLVGPSRY